MKLEAGKVDWSKLHKDPFPASSVYKTYGQWRIEDYRVMVGEIAHKWNKKGEALFNEEQVEPIEYDDWEDIDYSCWWWRED